MQSDLLLWGVLYRGMGDVYASLRLSCHLTFVLYQMYIIKRWEENRLNSRVSVQKNVSIIFFLFLNLKKCPWKNRGYCIWNVQSAGTLQIPVLFCILNLAQPSHVYTPFVFLSSPPPQKWNPILENIVFYSCIVKKCKSITETRVFA